MKTALVVAALAVAVSAHAQAADESLVTAQAGAVHVAAKAGRARSQTIDSALVAMNDGPEAGGRVTAYLNDKKVAVYTATQPEAVKTTVVNGQTSIILSDALPAHPRVYAPLIAFEAAKGIYADMPASGERSYMVMATAARVFAELGGDFAALPKVDGDDAPAVKDLVTPWLGGVEGAVDDLSARDGVKTLPELQAQAKDPAAAAALAAADKRFVAFLLDERDARPALKR